MEKKNAELTWILESETADFRQYEAQWLKGSGGVSYLLRKCEEWIEGRWEPFVAVVATERGR